MMSGLGRILFAEWADPRVSSLRGTAQPRPCPICGHPTGDCTIDQPANADTQE